MATIALTDIHGRFDCLYSMKQKLKQTLVGTDHTVILLGDYMDRGPQSKEVIQAIMSGTEFFDFAKEVIPLRGNHEDIFDTAICGRRWDMLLNNGGVATMASLLGCPEAEVERKIWPTDQISMKSADFTIEPLFKQILAFINEKCKIVHVAGKYLFVHAGINPFETVEHQLNNLKSNEDYFKDYFMWVRDAFLRENQDQGYKIVHGHTPHSHDYWRGAALYRINLDSGAPYTGLLSALVIHDINDVDANEIVTVKLPGKRQYFAD